MNELSISYNNDYDGTVTRIVVPAQTPQPGGKSEGGGWEGLIAMMLIMGVVLYLMVVVSNRQRKKQEKEREDMIGALKKGDEVETGGGVIGKVMQIENDIVILQVDDRKDIRIKFRKDMVRRVISDDTKKDKA